MSKEKVKKKDKRGSIRYKQANNIHSAEIKNQIKGALRPVAHTRRTFQSPRCDKSINNTKRSDMLLNTPPVGMQLLLVSWMAHGSRSASASGRLQLSNGVIFHCSSCVVVGLHTINKAVTDCRLRPWFAIAYIIPP